MRKNLEEFLVLVSFDQVKINFSWLIWQLICQEEKWFLHQVEGGPVKNTD